MAHWRAKTRGWWDERAVYWRSLPPPGTLWREITLTDDQLRLLQDERLVRARRPFYRAGIRVYNSVT